MSKKKGGVDKEGKGKSQSNLLGGGLHGTAAFQILPKLEDPTEAVGERVMLPGKFWDNCKEEDKEELFEATVLR